jgi:hypothetical protein
MESSGRLVVKRAPRTAFVLTSAAALLLALVCKKAPGNKAPATPAPPSGVASGGFNTSYEFSATTTDPEGDSVCLRFSWGDGDTSAWCAWVASGETSTMAHAWTDSDTYMVTAQAKDWSGLTSDWSQAHAVIIQTLSYEVVLSWGAHPRDLDAHLWTPEIQGLRYHVYYLATGTLDTAPYCSLDADNENGYGPERVAITTAFPGDYIYAVHHYAGDSTITTSHASVQLFFGGALTRTFLVPQEPAQDRTWWHVFKLDGTAGTVTELNVLSTGPPDLTDELPPKQPWKSSSRTAR